MVFWWWAACGGDDTKTDTDGGTTPAPHTAHTGAPTDTEPTPTDTEPTPPVHTGGGGGGEHTGLPALPEYRTPGPYAVDTVDTSSTATSCRSMAVTVYTPVGAPVGPAVVVAHGFSGQRRDMEGWGEHFASWGFTALVPQMCHSTPLNVDHEQNGLDLVALAAALAPGQVPFYVGYSAGGLAALVAAAEDPGAGGNLGLDMVDAFGVGGRAIPGLTAPAADLYAEPSACNTRNNGVPLYDGVGAPTLQIPGADHCDWMNPYQASCAFLCATGPEETRIPQAIATLATSWLLWQSGLDAQAARWWTPGADGYEQLVTDGWMVP
jgi:dienelactone hydrolase